MTTRPLLPPEILHPLSMQVAALWAFDQNDSFVGGSATIIAPGVAITATHVVDEIESRFAVGTDVLRFNMCLSLVHGGTWFVTHVSRQEHGDVALLSLLPWGEQVSHVCIRHVEMTTDLPTRGELVTAIGFPSSGLTIKSRGQSTKVEISLVPTVAEGHVENVHQFRRDSAVVTYPSFAVSAVYLRGMSGGPVYDRNKRICGVVSRGGDGALEDYSIAGVAWVAAGLSVSFEPAVAELIGVNPKVPIKLYTLAKMGKVSFHGLDEVVQGFREDGTHVIYLRNGKSRNEGGD